MIYSNCHVDRICLLDGARWSEAGNHFRDIIAKNRLRSLAVNSRRVNLERWSVLPLGLALEEVILFNTSSYTFPLLPASGSTKIVIEFHEVNKCDARREYFKEFTMDDLEEKIAYMTNLRQIEQEPDSLERKRLIRAVN